MLKLITNKRLYEHSWFHLAGSNMRQCLAHSISLLRLLYLARTCEILCWRCSSNFSLALKLAGPWTHQHITHTHTRVLPLAFSFISQSCIFNIVLPCVVVVRVSFICCTALCWTFHSSSFGFTVALMTRGGKHTVSASLTVVSIFLQHFLGHYL